MSLICLPSGRLRCNCYLLTNEERGEGILIDCGGTGEELILGAKQKGVRIVAILLTHGHTDHIEGVQRVVEEYNCPVYMHLYDKDYPTTPDYNLSARMYGHPMIMDFEVQTVKDGDAIEAAGFSLEVIHTPGHTAGCVCYRLNDQLFTGDTLFRESVGGDFPPFGDLETEINSIRMRLFSLNEDLVCYPGHGESTTLFYEMKNNMYCRV